MRTFIAIELPQEIKDYLAQLQQQLKETGADVKWVRPENIHLTLKFLGEIDDQQLEKIIQILEDITKDNATFSICLSSIGAFPKINFPRVIWVGIDKGDTETKQIAETLEDKIQKIGIPKENKPFSSHVTIGRTRSNLNRQRLIQGLDNLANNMAGKTQEFLVTKITLFKSTLTPKGPIYEVLKETNFKTI